MIEIKNIEVFGLNRAINAVSNSFNVGEIDTTVEPNDRNNSVAKSLGSNMQSHQSHDAWLKGILVEFDIKFNLATQPEFQRYHFFEFIMQQSRMHSIEKMLKSDNQPFTKYVLPSVIEIVERNYKLWVDNKNLLTELRNKFLDEQKKYDLSYSTEEKDEIFSNVSILREKIKLQEDEVYRSYMVLIHNLPCGIELWATIQTNYLQLKTMVIQRFHHKQREDWMNFVKACYSMPRFRELCGFTDSKWNLENW